jgi:hypothetical protein
MWWVSLQHDGFDDDAWRTLRGRALTREKQGNPCLLGEAGLTTTLTMTIAGGVNDAQIPPCWTACLPRRTPSV